MKLHLFKMDSKQGKFVLVRINEFGHATQRFFDSYSDALEAVEHARVYAESKGYELDLIDDVDPPTRGRPSRGITRKLSLTLPKSVWIDIERSREIKGMTLSAYIRSIIFKESFEEV